MRDHVGIYSVEEVTAAKNLVREMVRSVRGFRLYEGNHPVLERILNQMGMRWEEATSGGVLSLRLTQKEVLLDEEILYRASSRHDPLPTSLYDHGVVGLELSPGVDAEELRRFAGVLAVEPDPDTDFASLLWEGDFLSIRALLDTDEAEREPVSSATFASEVRKLSDDDDPRVPPQYEAERATAGAPIDEGEEELGPDVTTLTTAEHERLMNAVAADGFESTTRHAARTVCALAREDLTAQEATPLERTTKNLVKSTCRTGDVDGAIEMLDRAHAIRRSAQTLEQTIGELTIACFLDENNLRALLRTFDNKDYIEARALGDLLAKLGPSAAPEACHWLLETRHPAIVGPALKLYGPEAARLLVPMYREGTPENRSKITAALLEIGTPEALTALAAEFPRLPEPDRLQLLKVLGRSTDPTVRAVVVGTVDDPSERVRRAGCDALKKVDANAVARVLARMLETDRLAEFKEAEVLRLFETLARIGNDRIAEALAAPCRVKGLRRAFLKLTPIQVTCLRTLRRMRDPGARAVVDELKAASPRAVREILDDPFAGL